MTDPFFVFSLPRSRSLWLARLLTHGNRLVGHDIALDCETIDEFLDPFTLGMDGTVETGAMEGWPLIREAFPNAKIAVILRPMAEVVPSLERAGFPVDDVTLETLDARQKALHRLAQQPNVMSIPYNAMASETACVGLHEHLTGREPDRKWLRLVMDTNIQLDMPERVRKIVRNREKTIRLKAEVEMALARQAVGKWLRVGFESFETAWPDAKALTEAHFAEVSADATPWRPYVPAVNVFEQMARTGAMRVVTARQGGVLKGYLSWTLQPDLESQPVLLARQFAWYAQKKSAVGIRLMRRSMTLLKRLGVSYLEVHHRMNGRGEDLSSLFARLGAIPSQRNYTLRL